MHRLNEGFLLRTIVVNLTINYDFRYDGVINRDGKVDTLIRMRLSHIRIKEHLYQLYQPLRLLCSY